MFRRAWNGRVMVGLVAVLALLALLAAPHGNSAEPARVRVQSSELVGTEGVPYAAARLDALRIDDNDTRLARALHDCRVAPGLASLPVQRRPIGLSLARMRSGWCLILTRPRAPLQTARRSTCCSVVSRRRRSRKSACSAK